MDIAEPQSLMEKRPRTAQAALLLSWAVLFYLSFPRPGLWFLAHIDIVPLTLFALLTNLRFKQTLLLYLASAAWWILMVFWLREVTIPGWITIGFYLGTYPLVYAWLVRGITRRLNLPIWLAVPIIWTSLEYIRGLLITGFPWFFLGHSQPTLIIQIADIVGVYGVSFVVAMINGTVTELLVKRFDPTFTGKTQPSRSILIASVAIVTVLAYGLFRVAQFDDAAPACRVSVVQTDIPQSNKNFPSREQNERDFESAVKVTLDAIRSQPDLVLWPETVAPYAINHEAVKQFQRSREASYRVFYRDYLMKIAAEHDVPIVVGGHTLVNWHRHADGMRMVPRQRYNSAFVVSGQSTLFDRYDKIHRVPFGEYVPYIDTIPALTAALKALTPYSNDYALAAGTEYKTFTIRHSDGEIRFATPICMEDAVSYVTRGMVYGPRFSSATKQVDLLLNLTNDGWYPGSAQALQHEQIARFRCVELRVPMARAVNRGVSAFIDSCGRVSNRVQVDGKYQLVSGHATHEMSIDSRTTIFGMIGDLFASACLLTMIALTIRATIRWRADRNLQSQGEQS